MSSSLITIIMLGRFLLGNALPSSLLRSPRSTRQSVCHLSRHDAIRCIRTLSATQYTIDCPPTDPETLEKVVKKHLLSLPRYLKSKPVATHTAEAFAECQTAIFEQNDLPIVLDCGCGTGRSSLLLGSVYHKDAIVLGIDRSISRLSKNRGYDGAMSGKREAQTPNSSLDDEEVDNDGHAPTPALQQVADNVYLVRADLADFWRLLLENGYMSRVETLYMLYPNPYPKKSRLQSRFYAHPSFPLMLQIQPKRMVLRSNWRTYLEEFAQAARLAGEEKLGICLDEDEPSAKDSPQEYQWQKPKVTRIEPNNEPWTNFEDKYFKAGETVYELVVEK